MHIFTLVAFTYWPTETFSIQHNLQNLNQPLGCTTVHFQNFILFF